MFIRIKSRKNSSNQILKYAYLVSSKRRKKSKKAPKQKVLAYLGKVIELKEFKQENFEISKSYEETILHMLKALLLFNNFKEKTKYSFLKGNILVDLADKEVKDLNSGQNISLKVNEGFITRPTLKKAIDYNPPEATEKEIGKDLAKALVSVGLKPSEAVFLGLFRNLIKQFHRK